MLPRAMPEWSNAASLMNAPLLITGAEGSGLKSATTEPADEVGNFVNHVGAAEVTLLR